MMSTPTPRPGSALILHGTEFAEPTSEKRSQSRSAGSPDADRVLREMLGVLPNDHLIPRPPAVQTPAELACDPVWLREQIRLRGLIWGIEDPYVLGTLWWYSASSWLVMPTVTSWFSTGQALSARLEDLLLFHQPDSRIPGARSVQLGPGSVEQVGAQLRESMAEVIEALLAIIGKGERRLWSFVVDAIAGRMLWAAQHTDRTDEVEERSCELVAAMGRDLPRPRLTALEILTFRDTEQRLQVRRGSCCLLYQIPEKNKCGNCPRQPPDVRRRRLAAERAPRS